MLIDESFDDQRIADVAKEVSAKKQLDAAVHVRNQQISINCGRNECSAVRRGRRDEVNSEILCFRQVNVGGETAVSASEVYNLFHVTCRYMIDNVLEGWRQITSTAILDILNFWRISVL